MTVALRSPSLLRALIPVDNSPINANLNSDFYKYVQGMREIEGKQVRKQLEADKILEDYEKGSEILSFCSCHHSNIGATGFSHPTIPTHQSR